MLGMLTLSYDTCGTFGPINWVFWIKVFKDSLFFYMELKQQRRTYVMRKPSKGLLYIGDLHKDCCLKKGLVTEKSSTNDFPSTEDLCKLFCLWKTFRRSAVIRRPSNGLLSTNNLQNFFRLRIVFQKSFENQTPF